MNKYFAFLIVLILVGGSGYIVWNRPASSEYQKPPIVEIEKPRSIDIVFVGDIMLDRGVAVRAREGGFEKLFENILPLFQDADIVIGNLEGSVTEKPSVAQANYGQMRFTFASTTPEFLKSIGFSGVSLANNHALDYGKDGFTETKKFLSEAGLLSFGSPLNTGELSGRIERNSEKVCFVGYHSLFSEDVTPVNAEIQRIRPECSFLVVVAHWGEEYMDEENAAQRRQGRGFVDVGADLVIGAHPHVVQPVEIYNGRPIFYSLGNFMFDQDFSLPTRQGIAIRMTLSDSEETYQIVPVELSTGSVLSFPEKESFKSRMDILISKLPDPLKTSADIDSEFTIPR